jgi:CRISPR-associated endoribonuclease Cas6
MVNLNFTVKSLGSYSQTNLKYLSSMKAFFYELLKESNWSLKNTENKFTNWTYSNLYPIKNNELKEYNFEKKQGLYYFDFKTSNTDLLFYLINKLNDIKKINLGEGQFEIIQVKPERENLTFKNKLSCVTPICLRVKRDKNKFLNYELNDTEKELFEKTLKVNMINKYNFLEKKEIDMNFNLFENVKINKKTKKNGKSFISNEIYKNDEKIKNFKLYVCGNLLEFEFTGYLNEDQKKIFEFNFNNGFGSHTSYGMGYLREIKK